MTLAYNIDCSQWNITYSDLRGSEPVISNAQTSDEVVAEFIAIVARFELRKQL